MRILHLEQDSPEWHEFRKKHIGGSDAPAIMGVSPYKTRYELWIEKTSEEETQSYQSSAMQRGKELESKARELFNLEHFYMCIPCVFEHPTIPYLSYSSDGYDADNEILIEIKCGTKQEHEDVKRGIVPTKYYPQLQHALLVTGLDEIYYVSYHNDEIAYTKVKRDDFYIDKMIREFEDFWECVQKKEEPTIDEVHKKHTKTHFETIDNDLFKVYADHWIDLQQRKKDIELEEKELRNEIIHMTGGSNVEGDGIRVQQYEKKGAVAYKMIPELKDVDLEQYRSHKSMCWRIDIAHVKEVNRIIA